MDYIGNTYWTNFVDKYGRENDPLPQLLHSRQACDKFQREEVQQDKDVYSLNLTRNTIDNIKYHNKFEGKKYKRISYIYCLNPKTKSHNNLYIFVSIRGVIKEHLHCYTNVTCT